jgi:molybdopterin-guanine dinucleotide biosynthesis protein A
MGQDKALLQFEGRPLVLRAGELVQEVCGDATIVGDPAKFAAWGFPVIRDLYPDRGPLGGIHAALQHCDAPLALVVGCDMPYLSPEFLEFLVGLARESEADAVIPESEAFGYEPLCAVYARACLAPIEQALREDRRKISEVFGRLNLRLIPPAEWKPYDPEGRLFRNLNTREEYEQARRGLLIRVAEPRV